MNRQIVYYAAAGIAAIAFSFSPVTVKAQSNTAEVYESTPWYKSDNTESTVTYKSDRQEVIEDNSCGSMTSTIGCTDEMGGDDSENESHPIKTAGVIIAAVIPLISLAFMTALMVVKKVNQKNRH